MKPTPEQVLEVRLLLLKGATPDHVVMDRATNHGWDEELSRAAIKAAIASIRSQAPKGTPPQVAMAIAQRNLLMLECWRVNDLRTALAAQKDVASLLNLYQRPAAKVRETFEVASLPDGDDESGGDICDRVLANFRGDHGKARATSNAADDQPDSGRNR